MVHTLKQYENSYGESLKRVLFSAAIQFSVEPAALEITFRQCVKRCCMSVTSLTRVSDSPVLLPQYEKGASIGNGHNLLLGLETFCLHRNANFKEDRERDHNDRSAAEVWPEDTFMFYLNSTSCSILLCCMTMLFTAVTWCGIGEPVVTIHWNTLNVSKHH